MGSLAVIDAKKYLSEIIIHGIGYKRKGSDLREIRLNYSKIKNSIKS